jgi:uncharacterized membrane-anchored protein
LQAFRARVTWSVGHAIVPADADGAVVGLQRVEERQFVVGET